MIKLERDVKLNQKKKILITKVDPRDKNFDALNTYSILRPYCIAASSVSRHVHIT